jgi:hypothetical protein
VLGTPKVQEEQKRVEEWAVDKILQWKKKFDEDTASIYEASGYKFQNGVADSEEGKENIDVTGKGGKEKADVTDST